jgi:hypothetical protein
MNSHHDVPSERIDKLAIRQCVYFRIVLLLMLVVVAAATPATVAQFKRHSYTVACPRVPYLDRRE